VLALLNLSIVFHSFFSGDALIVLRIREKCRLLTLTRVHVNDSFGDIQLTYSFETTS
jgi:hypothetical protein